MKMLRNYLWLFFFILIVSNNLFAQDPIFSQPFANSVYTNPGFAGSKGVARFGANSRMQWITPLAKLNMHTFTGDVNFGNLGVGMYGCYDKESPAFTFTDVVGGASYRIGDLQKFVFIPGIQFAYLNRNMNWDKLVFRDQLDPLLGVVDQASTADQPYENLNLFDINAGGVIQFPLELHRSIPGFVNLGYALHHIRKNTDQYLKSGSYETVFPRRHVIHGGMLMKIHKRDTNTWQKIPTKWMLYPNFKYELHNKMTVVDMGVIGYRAPFLMGLTLRTHSNFYKIRNANQLVTMLGWEGNIFKSPYIKTQIAYSFDWTFTGLNFGKESPSFLTHEITLVFVFSPKRKKDCLAALNDTKRWFDSDKLQRRYPQTCAPGKRARVKADEVTPLFYPIELPTHD